MSVEAFYERFVAKLDKYVEDAMNGVLAANRTGNTNRAVLLTGQIDAFHDVAKVAVEVRQTFLSPLEQPPEREDERKSLY